MGIQCIIITFLSKWMIIAIIYLLRWNHTVCSNELAGFQKGTNIDSYLVLNTMHHSHYCSTFLTHHSLHQHHRLQHRLGDQMLLGRNHLWLQNTIMMEINQIPRKKNNFILYLLILTFYSNTIECMKFSSLELFISFSWCSQVKNWLTPKVYTSLTNRVWGPYCKLRSTFFPIDLWPKCKACGP